MQPLSPETTIKILRSSLQYNLPNDCQALAKQRLSCVARGKGGWKSTRQEPTLEKLNLRLPLQRYRTRRPGFPGHPAPLRGGAPPARCQRPEPQLAAALRRLPVRGAAGAAGVEGGGEIAGRSAGRGLAPHRRRGLRGRSPPGTQPAGRAQTKARRPRSARGGGEDARAGADGRGPPPQAARRPRLAPAPAPAWPAAPTHRPGPCP